MKLGTGVMYKFVIVVCVAGVIAFALWLFTTDSTQITIKATFGTAFFSLIGILLTQFYTNRRNIAVQLEVKRRESNARLFLEKSKAYDKFFDMQNRVVKNSKSEEFETDEDLKNFIEDQMTEFRKDVLTWGSAATIKALHKWSKSSLGFSGENNVDVLKANEELMSTMRRDLGHEDDSLEDGDLACIFVIPEDHVKVKCLFANETT